MKSFWDIFPTPEERVREIIKNDERLKLWKKTHKTHGDRIEFPRLSSPSEET